MGAGVAGAGGGRAARALRLLLLLVMALAAVEYLFGTLLDASPLRTYLYTPLYNATQPTIKLREKSSSSWPKRLPAAVSSINPDLINTTQTLLETRKPVVNMTYLSINCTTTTTKKPESSTPLLITKLMKSIQTLVATTTTKEENVSETSTAPELPFCTVPTNLGPIPVNRASIDLASLDLKFPEISIGGRYKPKNCTAKHKVAIIVPYRNRQQHLALFLNHMHPFLMRQQIEYGIFIIEQQGSNDFNRAKLFNVGFVESNRQYPGGWQCFIFHDVDLLPMDERNLYTCPRQPRHMSASIDKYNYKLPYEDIFGGVSAMTYEQFTKVNGFSNKYWGWGGEDDDMAYRLKRMHYHIARYKMSIARYSMLQHKSATPNPKRYKLLSQRSKNFQKDGLATLQYELVEVIKHRLFTLISVNIDENS